MKLFTQISIEGQCCQKYGICGEQYSQDIVFDDYGRVETTRFRFQHQPLKYQEDYIQAVVETRKATDKFAERLTPVSYNDVNVDLKLSQPRGLMQKLKSFVGLGSKEQDLIDAEAESPIVFCYSLFYVYYDQYTYITGVLAQDVMMGLIGVFFAIQVSSKSSQILPLFSYIDLKFSSNLLIHYSLCVPCVL
jgi:Niemann-Pick C1 protein